ncbi:MAG: S-layer homology domain-containing protein [Actinobacteria bacterium]|nr:S-layer homology domain-containing protein [Acidimicrobiia bacterium]NDH87684.1 S-layer homology domain-containing protein [Actinomycetota bacterium]NDH98332.1 S-layer homology domain-containing protein [Actinomycetota bacterium]
MAVAAALAASLTVTTPATSFGDVDPDRWYSEAATWMETAGISTGTSPGCFQPDRLVSRAEAVTFLHRLAGAPAPTSESRAWPLTTRRW